MNAPYRANMLLASIQQLQSEDETLDVLRKLAVGLSESDDGLSPLQDEVLNLVNRLTGDLKDELQTVFGKSSGRSFADRYAHFTDDDLIVLADLIGYGMAFATTDDSVRTKLIESIDADIEALGEVAISPFQQRFTVWRMIGGQAAGSDLFRSMLAALLEESNDDSRVVTMSQATERLQLAKQAASGGAWDVARDALVAALGQGYPLLNDDSSTAPKSKFLLRGAVRKTVPRAVVAGPFGLIAEPPQYDGIRKQLWKLIEDARNAGPEIEISETLRKCVLVNSPARQICSYSSVEPDTYLNIKTNYGPTSESTLRLLVDVSRDEGTLEDLRVEIDRRLVSPTSDSVLSLSCLKLLASEPSNARTTLSLISTQLDDVAARSTLTRPDRDVVLQTLSVCDTAIITEEYGYVLASLSKAIAQDPSLADCLSMLNFLYKRMAGHAVISSTALKETLPAMREVIEARGSTYQSSSFVSTTWSQFESDVLSESLRKGNFAWSIASGDLLVKRLESDQATRTVQNLVETVCSSEDDNWIPLLTEFAAKYPRQFAGARSSYFTIDLPDGGDEQWANDNLKTSLLVPVALPDLRITTIGFALVDIAKRVDQLASLSGQLEKIDIGIANSNGVVPKSKLAALLEMEFLSLQGLVQLELGNLTKATEIASLIRETFEDVPAWSSEKTDLPLPIHSIALLARLIDNGIGDSHIKETLRVSIDHARNRQVSRTTASVIAAVRTRLEGSLVDTTGDLKLKHFVWIGEGTSWVDNSLLKRPWVMRSNSTTSVGGGSSTNRMLLRYPVVGDFELELRFESDGMGAVDPHYDAITPYFPNGKDELKLLFGKYRPSKIIPLDGQSKEDRQPIRLAVSDAKVTISTNRIQRVSFPVSTNSPFVGISWPGSRMVEVTDFELKGGVTIPRRVNLLGKGLAGWGGTQSRMIGERKVDDAAPTRTLDPSPWCSLDDNGSLILGSPPINYRDHYFMIHSRPLLDGERVTFAAESLSGERGGLLVVGDVILEVSSSGSVRSHWFAQPFRKQLDVMLRDLPDSWAGDGLGAGKWKQGEVNQVQLIGESDSIAVKINDATIANIPIYRNRRIGFVTVKNLSMRVSDMVLQGDWPTELPSDLWELNK
ncbi:MAG: hypothetical protein AAF664_01200 [Planctomycetota bacterium]